MARTRQTARKSTGGKAPRKMVAVRGKGGKGLGKPSSSYNYSYNYALPAQSTSSQLSYLQGQTQQLQTQQLQQQNFGQSSGQSLTLKGPAYSYSYPVTSLSSFSTPSLKDEVDNDTEIIEIPNFESDVSFESSFYAHFFETGHEGSKVLVPRYAVASIKHPFTNDQEVRK